MRNLPFVTIVAAALLATSITACGHKGNSNVTTQSGGGQNANAGGPVIVAAGTDFSGKLQQTIGSKSSKDGDTFAIDETSSSSSALNGAVIEGHLANLEPAGPMRNAKMTLVFDDVRMPDGTKDPVNVQLVSTQAFDPATHHLRTVGMMVAGAIAGHELAKHTGSKHGGLAGAVGGYVLSQQLKTDISVPAGSVLVLKFVSPVNGGSSGQ